MTGLILPGPSDPPSRDVDEALELLRVARVEHGHAEARWRRVLTWAADPMNSPADRMKFRVQQSARQHEVKLWVDELNVLEARVRALGLRP